MDRAEKRVALGFGLCLGLMGFGRQGETSRVGELLPIEMLRRGECGQVACVVGQDHVVSQLAERGLCQGCSVEILAQGNPCLCLVGRTRLSIRTDTRVQVMVWPQREGSTHGRGDWAASADKVEAVV